MQHASQTVCLVPNTQVNVLAREPAARRCAQLEEELKATRCEVAHKDKALEATEASLEALRDQLRAGGAAGLAGAASPAASPVVRPGKVLHACCGGACPCAAPVRRCCVQASQSCMHQG